MPYYISTDIVAVHLICGYFTLSHQLISRDKFAISPDGYGRILGRLKEIIVRGGENITPKEIEDVLNTHPDIIESQVIVFFFS